MKMTPKHNMPPKSMDGLGTKDTLRAQAMKECNKGITSCQTTRGKTKGYGTISTEYGSKPVPHK